MTGLKIGYARVSTTNQDLTAQRGGLAALGVDVDRIYVDHGLTGTTRARPGLREALAACRTGDTLVVTKLDRLARSLPDARDIVEELTTRGVRLQLGGSVHDPTDPVGRLLFNVLAMVAEFESDLIKARTREGLAVARARRQAPRTQAQAHARTGGATRRPAQDRPEEPVRPGGAVRRRPVHGLPRARARGRYVPCWQRRSSPGHIAMSETAPDTAASHTAAAVS